MHHFWRFSQKKRNEFQAQTGVYFVSVYAFMAVWVIVWVWNMTGLGRAFFQQLQKAGRNHTNSGFYFRRFVGDWWNANRECVLRRWSSEVSPHLPAHEVPPFSFARSKWVLFRQPTVRSRCRRNVTAWLVLFVCFVITSFRLIIVMIWWFFRKTKYSSDLPLGGSHCGLHMEDAGSGYRS